VSTTIPNLIFGSANYPDPSPGPVVTIGNFDGVHKGHRKLLERVQQLARENERPTAVYTFDPAPRDVIRPDNGIPRIQRLEDKVAKLHRLGIDQVIVENFTLEFAKNEAQWFAHEVIRRRLGASALVVGWDFHFGRNRSGNFADLSEWLDIPVHRFDAYKEENKVISSSRIREALRAGEVQAASRLLENPHEILGEVVRGDQRGRELGFPTANISAPNRLLPAQGVYAVEVESADGRHYAGVANIGTRPTFGPSDQQVEVHLFDFQGDLYGQPIRVRWIERLRGEQRFENRQELIARIQLDVKRAREIFAGRS
jgi:riboflavin kinase / FMN adenylyltransferase